MTLLPTKACWQADSVAQVISNEALEGAEGVFLATHTPITGFQVLGSHAGEIQEPSERGVLNALTDETRKHAFCVVQGEPGSGKSHLIRWLSVNWPDRGDLKLLLQRADGSLEGALRQLQEKLPPEFSDLFDKLGQRHRAGLKGRATLFLSNLAASLAPKHFDPPLDDAAWCEANFPGELLFFKQVRDEWPAPERILNLIDGAERNRNSESASFNLFDMESLARACSTVRGSGVVAKAETLAERLIQEAATIREHQAAGWTAEEVEREVSGLRASRDLMGALNRRRNDAVQQVLGVSAEGLKTLFRQVRQALAKRNQRLILLLEDITSWEGVDDSLIDVLVTNARTRGVDGADEGSDMCPLISVVGVTPAYYKRLHGNYRGRITHEISLGDSAGDGLQDVATLRRSEDRRAFASRYLAAVRAGPPRLNAWRETVRAVDAPPPNACDDCAARQGCFAAFGEHDRVGLFPFNARALDTMFQALNEHDNGMTWKTPRGLLQAVLSPTLSQPFAIEAGLYPTALIENEALDPQSRLLSPRLKEVVDAREDDLEEQRRLKRLISYWGDKERADTTLTATGELAFAGVPKSIFEALQAGWVGEARAATVDAAAFAPPDVQAPLNDADLVEPELLDGAEPPSKTEGLTVRRLGAALNTNAGPKTLEPPSRRAGPTRSELERQRAQLRSWNATGKLENPSDWNNMAYRLVNQLSPRDLGVDPYTFTRLITAERVKIEGTAPANRNYLLLKLEPWLVEGLEALLALRLDQNLSGGDAEYHRQRLARLMRRLGEITASYVDHRLGRSQTAPAWSPIGSMAQVLLARAWLRGAVSPEAPLVAQLSAILADETDTGGDINARCLPWREFLNATHAWQQRYRDALFEALSLSQGRASGFGLLNAQWVAAPILRMTSTLRFDEVPEGARDTGASEIEKLPELINGAQSLLGRILSVEGQQIRNRAEALRQTLRGRGVKAHLERVDQAINAVASSLPQAAPDRVAAWNQGFGKTKERFEEGRDEMVEDLIAQFDGDGPPTDARALLDWLSKAPARDLEEFRGQSAIGESVIEALLPQVKDYAGDRSSGSLDSIHNLGRRLELVVKAADQASMDGPHD